jgi:hypothetical protein
MKQTIKRRRKQTTISVKYFNENTQDAIVLFQKSVNRREREKLYAEEIMPAFKKLVENLINIHRFVGLHDSYDDLKNDCINFLFETIGKFDPTRGTNAFSYFNVVAKNWLIIKTKQKNSYSKKSVSLDDEINLSNDDITVIENYNSLPSQDSILDSAGLNENMINMLYEIRNEIRSENELACVNSIITIFENIGEIDLLNKSAVLLYMKELSGLSPKQLTMAMQGIKRQYRSLKNERRYQDE